MNVLYLPEWDYDVECLNCDRVYRWPRPPQPKTKCPVCEKREFKTEKIPRGEE